MIKAKISKKWGSLGIIVWAVILISLLLVPDTAIPASFGFQYFDKIAHFGLFFITGTVSIIGSTFLNKFKSQVIFGILFGLLLAVMTEFAQYIIPSRTMSFYDLIADVVGLFAALLFVIIF